MYGYFYTYLVEIDVSCNIQIYWQRTLKPPNMNYHTECLIILRKHEFQLHEVYQMRWIITTMLRLNIAAEKRCQARKKLAAGPFCTTHLKGLEIFIFASVFGAIWFDSIMPHGRKRCQLAHLWQDEMTTLFILSNTYCIHRHSFIFRSSTNPRYTVPFRLGLGKVTHSHNAKVEPDWDLSTALWYVMVTATTVGGISWQKQPAVTRCVLFQRFLGRKVLWNHYFKSCPKW